MTWPHLMSERTMSLLLQKERRGYVERCDIPAAQEVSPVQAAHPAFILNNFVEV